MTDYLEQLLERLEEPKEKETSITAQTAWKPQTGTARHSRAGRLKKLVRPGEMTPAPDGQESLEAGGSIREWDVVQASDPARDEQIPGSMRDVRAPGLVQDVQLPDSVWDAQIPGSMRDVQAPGSARDIQTPDSVWDAQIPGSMRDVRAPGLVQDVQLPDSVWDAQLPGSMRDVQAPGLVWDVQIPGSSSYAQGRKFLPGLDGDRRWKLFPPSMKKAFASGMAETFTASREYAQPYNAESAALYGTQGAPLYGMEGAARAGALDTPHYGAGKLPVWAVEEARDALSRSESVASPWNGTRLSAEYWGIAPVQRTPAASFGSAAAMLEQRLAQSMAWTAAPRAPGTAAVQDVTGTELDLEELDQKVRRDARRYDGVLTPY